MATIQKEAVLQTATEPATPRRGRGRPRKHQVMTGQTLVAAAPIPVQAPVTEVKRGRSRPRKNPVSAAPAPVVEPVTSVKRGRGRPRKHPLPISAPVTAASAPINLKPVPAKAPIRISHAKALELMENNKGHYFTAVFIKKDQTERTMNCKLMANQVPDRLGYIKVKEAVLLRQGKNAIRNVNLQTLKALQIGKKSYRVGA